MASGWREGSRTKLDEVLTAASTDLCDILMVTELSRLSRRAIDVQFVAETLTEAGRQLVSIMEPHMDTCFPAGSGWLRRLLEEAPRT